MCGSFILYAPLDSRLCVVSLSMPILGGLNTYKYASFELPTVDLLEDTQSAAEMISVR